MSNEADHEILGFLRQNEIGRRARVHTPFGQRLITYADLTASGRYLHFVEAWFRNVRPFYANTHTAVSSTGRISTELREESRAVVSKSVGANEDYVTVFCGAGATAAINKIVGVLGLAIPEPLQRRYNLAQYIPAEERPIVFVGPYEHHSNYLPWLESIADVVEIPPRECGAVNLDVLAEKLEEYKGRPLKLGSFSAASNVTGILADVRGICRTLHAGGAKAIFDYAAAGPYVPIQMVVDDPAECIDAVVISTHKFLGGPGGSGVLVAHKDFFVSRTPALPGGGTVDYVGAVSYESVDYVRHLDEREEGGTPSIMGDLRAGTAFLVKDMVGAQSILDHEIELAASAVERLDRHPNIRVLGPKAAPRLAIISIIFEGLHHDFACGLLDHVFGVQSRSGCACAGPYGHTLLDIDADTSEAYRNVVGRGLTGMKPGWVRLSLPYYASEEDLEFVLSAVEFVATYGKEFVPSYRFDWSNGVWTHMHLDMDTTLPFELSVGSLQEAAACFAAGDHETPLNDAQIAAERASYFKEAKAQLATMRAQAAQVEPVWNPCCGDDSIQDLIWFAYTNTTDLSEALA
ncbi:MAG: aminotransferase class V-fold PLP-dependent enzyme [Planctomycetota bacterium]|nr:aminotransferase class V-fold PLP-dependent enzyme [Planctomycetota bacterium]